MTRNNPENIPRVLKLVELINHREVVNRVLDIRIGWGRYGLLLREQLDISSIHTEKKDWTLTIDGVAIRSEYVNSHTNYLYNTIYISPIETWAPNYKGHPYDIVIWADGIEYAYVSSVQKIVNSILGYCKWFIIVTPSGPNNPYMSIRNNVQIDPDNLAWDDHSKVALLKGVIPSTIKKEDILSLL